MAGASQVATQLVTSHARKCTRNPPRARSTIGCDMRRATKRKRVAFGDQNLLHVRDQFVRTIRARISAHIATRIVAPSGRRYRPPGTDTDTGGPWRERPLRTGAGPSRARAPGSLTPWFPALAATSAPCGGRQKAPPTRRGVGALSEEICAANRLRPSTMRVTGKRCGSEANSR